MRMIAGTTWRVEDARKYIEDRVMIVPWSGCWLWERAINNGYGAFCWPEGVQERKSARAYAHRLAYEAFVGPVPDGAGYHGTVVMHTCDVRACCNPDHLRLGTQADNVADMDGKGRRVPPRTRRVLSRDEITLIRERWLRGEAAKHIAASMGVSRATVFTHIRAVRGDGAPVPDAGAGGHGCAD